MYVNEFQVYQSISKLGFDQSKHSDLPKKLSIDLISCSYYLLQGYIAKVDTSTAISIGTFLDIHGWKYG